MNLSYSQAIRLGSLLKPQGFGLYRDRTLTACANDAAVLAVGRDMAEFFTIFPIAKQPSLCPRCEWPGWRINLGVLVAHLNDVHRWTREDIAAFVQGYEEAEAERLGRESAILARAGNYQMQRPDVPMVQALSDQMDDPTGDLARSCTVTIGGQDAK